MKAKEILVVTTVYTSLNFLPQPMSKALEDMAF